MLISTIEEVLEMALNKGRMTRLLLLTLEPIDF